MYVFIPYFEGFLSVGQNSWADVFLKDCSTQISLHLQLKNSLVEDIKEIFWKMFT